MAKKSGRAPVTTADDLVRPSMLPDKPTIPEWRSFGYGASSPKPRTPPNAKKKRTGGTIHASASKRADGIAKKGKTRGKFV